jgi:hypothetical protein
MLATNKNTNLLSKTITTPHTNERQAVHSLLPERFTSTTKPIQGSIISPDLNTVSEPKPSRHCEQIP